MSGTRILIELLGEIALLLWGIHMVHSGVLRAYGSKLRHILGIALENRLKAFFAGLFVTTLLQSSTATAFMAASFTAGGVVDLAAALAVMLGANVGTTLIVQVLSFDIAVVFPVLIFLGVALFRNATGRLRDLSRVAIGLGLILLALHLMIQTIEPVEAAPLLRQVLLAIGHEPLLNIAVAAAFTWAAHSSVAAMLFVMSLANAGVIGTEALLAMVLGANLGSAINPIFEGTHGDPVKLRMPLGNLLNRLLGCLLVLPFLPLLADWLNAIHVTQGRLAADFHTAFNLVLALAFILPLQNFSALLERLLPEKPRDADEATPRYLDDAAIETPTAALSNAAREALRMADVASRMLRGLEGIFAVDDRRRIAEIRRTDDIVDRLNAAIQTYLTEISRQELGDEDRQRLAEVLAFAINIEHIGDSIEKSILELAAKRLKRRLSLSREGLEDIEAMRRLLLDHLQLASHVFVSGDPKLARRLIREKEKFREMESASRESHFARKRAGRAESLETSSLHVDIVRDFKLIDGFIAATVYPLLERTGHLVPSRLAASGSA
jgi:phosphate:Na+ symporter